MLRRLPLLLFAALAATLTLWAVRSAPISSAEPPGADLDLRDGDLLFQSMGGRQGDAIALATGSPWTHVGMAFRTGDHWQVIEAVGPVKYTPLDEWLIQGDGTCVVKRLKDTAPVASAKAVHALRTAAEAHQGKPYDLLFRWEDERIYCSELVWKAYRDGLGIRLCEPRPLRDYDLDSDLVQRVMRERYGAAPPLDEPMVAPSTLFDCPLLRTVAERSGP
jgi:hypothetical protein